MILTLCVFNIGNFHNNQYPELRQCEQCVECEFARQHQQQCLLSEKSDKCPYQTLSVISINCIIESHKYFIILLFCLIMFIS